MINRRTVVRRVAPITILVISIAVLLSLFVVATQRMSNLRQAPGDNLTWALSQAEVELLLLHEETTKSLRSEQTTFKDLRRKFDNFHSRITGISESPVFAPMRTNPTFSQQLNKLLKCFEFTTPLVDVDDLQLKENLPFVLLGLNGVRSDVHDIALTGIALRSKKSDAERESFSKLLMYAALVSLALILFLVFVLFYLLRQYQVHRNTAAEVERANTRLKSTFQVSLDAIIVADEKGVILDFNRSAEAVFGFSKEEAIGAQMAELIVPPQYREAHYAGMERFNKTREPRLVGQGRIEITALRKSGEEFPVEISIGQAQDHRGAIFISYLRDITERLAAEQDLKQARDDALQAEKAKSNFLAVMSHEMRTPLNGLFGTMELLQKTKLTKKQENYVEIAQRSGNILLHHVNDVLDVSRLDESKLELNESDFNLVSFFEEIVSSNSSIAEKVGNQLELSMNNMPEKNVHMDEHRLRQIVYNLVSNALKFTSNGSVAIDVQTINETDESRLLRFDIIDDGVGIPPEELLLIFERFYTKENAYDRLASGAGLGLTICKQIINLMGGEISVASDVGRKTVFSVSIPLTLSEAQSNSISAETVPGAYSDLRGQKILLAEDNEINRLIVCEMLQGEGLDVTQAHNGRQAVDLAKTTKFSAILMDISMPLMNGVDATKLIRNTENPNKNSAILALTAHVLAEEQANFIAAGMNQCIDKPVSQNALILAITSAIEGSADFAYTETSSALIDHEIISGLKNVLSPEKLSNLVSSFETEIEELQSQLPSQLNSNELPELAKASHKSVGSASMMGVRVLKDKLRALEKAAKHGDLAGTKAAVAQLESQWPISREALRSALLNYPLG